MLRPPTLARSALALAILTGCGDDQASGDASSGTSSTTGTAAASTRGTGSTTDDSTTSSGGADVTTGTTDPQPDVAPIGPGPGRGISVVGVETYQALQTAPNAGPGLSVTLIPGRPALLRFFVNIDEDLWDKVSPNGRAMVARLDIQSAGGEQQELTAEPFVFRDSADYNFESTIQFEVPGEWVETGLQYRLEVDEYHPEVGVLPLPDMHPSYPAEPGALASLTIEPTPTVPPRLRVHLLPYDYQAGCSASVQLDEEKLEILREDLATLYPIVDLELTVADPVLWTTPLSSLNPVLTNIYARRNLDNPDPDVYYAGLIDVCNDCPDCNGGFGYYAEPTVEDAPFRVSINRTYGSSYEGKAYAQDMVRILSHEIGHNHNLQHNPCTNPNGDPGETNPTYPHAAGAIGAFGYRFSTDELVGDTSSYDLMTYCNPIWVSDWTWNRLDSHISALAGAVGAQSDVEPRTSLLVSVDRDGQPTSIRWAPMNQQTAARFEADDGPRLRVRAGNREHQLALRTIEVDHSDAKFLQLPVPHELELARGHLEVPTPKGLVRLPIPARP